METEVEVTKKSPKNKSLFGKIRRFFRNIKERSLIALMATVVSTCALCVSLYQAKLMRKQQFASVWPYVSIGGSSTAYDRKQAWGIGFTNNGLGPAIIEKVTIKYAGQEMPFNELRDTLYSHHKRLDSLKNLNYSIREVEPGGVIPANSSIEWLSFDLEFNADPTGAPSSQTHMTNLEVRVQYRSLYGELWESCFNCPDQGDEVRKLE